MRMALRSPPCARKRAAKGLNLAVADVRLLSRALIEHYAGNDSYIDSYSQTVLNRVWKVERFSWQLSTLMHQFPENSPFEKKMQRAEFDYIASSEGAATRASGTM